MERHRQNDMVEGLRDSADWCEEELSRGPLQFSSYSVRELEEAVEVYKTILTLMYANADILGGTHHIQAVIFLKTALSTADKVANAIEN